MIPQPAHLFAAAAAPAPRAVRLWLLAVAVLVIAMILVGGATRLTDSGLSITEWKPIHGVIPPLDAADWAEEFEKYRQIPEYELVNKGMSLDEFKTIFWWEWGHRLLGRLIGVAFAVPLAIFWFAGMLPVRMRPMLLGLLALGALQGAIGWWMVASGLVERVDVSQYRLAVHLTMAFLILAGLVWAAEDAHGRPPEPSTAAVRRVAGLILAAVFLQIFLGGLVAGLKAGWTYNTWPLLDGALVPKGLLIQSPWWANLFENPKTVQFDHRLVAYGLVALAIFHAVQSARVLPAEALPGSRAAHRAAWLVALVIAQATIGIAALVAVVPMWLGLAHQLGAVAVLWMATVHLHRLRAAA
jgi:cytochrome c oxidase assembly protein subunit 15